MPLQRQVPDKPIRIGFNDVTLVGANSDAPRATAFTVPKGRKFTLYAIGTDQNAAAVDLIAFKVTGPQSIQLVDLPTNRLPTDERIVPLWEAFAEGDALTVGIRNGTGAGITPQLTWLYADEAA